MKKILGTKEKMSNEVISLDLTVVLPYMGKIVQNKFTEISIVTNYSYKTYKNEDTLTKYKVDLKKYLNVVSDKELFIAIKMDIFNNIYFKIKTTIDALLLREVGCEISNMKFKEIKVFTNKELLVDFEIEYL